MSRPATPIPEAWSYGALRRFHRAARAMMVSTPSLESELTGRGFRNIMRWTRGVDTTLFRPRHERVLDAASPIFLYVGRVAVEKNLDAFLSLDLPGTKVVVGDGPARGELERRYPQARFLGALTGEDLARVYASADVFVFPSLTDTFGIVLLEALASGLPIAAFPVTGPLDVIGASGCGILDWDLRQAALEALALPKEQVPRLWRDLHLARERKAVLLEHREGPRRDVARPTSGKRDAGGDAGPSHPRKGRVPPRSPSDRTSHRRGRSSRGCGVPDNGRSAPYA